MTCLGRHGRWGNTLMAYFFLTAFARVHRMTPEVPRWIGQDLFGTPDDAISRVHPVILYDMVSELCRESRHPMVMFNVSASRARTVRESHERSLFVLRDPLLSDPAPPLPATAVDLEGPFILHTRHLSPHRDVFRRLAQPVPALQERLEAGWQNLRRRGDAVIGVHVRRSDFDFVFSQQGFEFIAPMPWYLSWLERVWPRYERPILFVATDSPERVMPSLARYRPVTSRDLRVELPPHLLNLDLPPAHVERDATFFPDWFMLTRCDTVAISNSTFSFTACMMNETASEFVRPDPQRKALVPFDPWDSEPLLFLSEARNLLQDVVQRLSLAQQGLGLGATVRNLRRALHWYRTLLRIRAATCRYFRGDRGLVRELLRPQFYVATWRRYDEPPVGSAEPEIPETRRRSRI